MPAWSEFLVLLEAVVSDPQVAGIIDHPLIERKDVVTLICDVCESSLFKEAENLVRLLAQNRRLESVSAIRERYEKLRAEAENRLDIDVVTAAPIAADVLSKLQEALEKRLQRQVSLKVEVDESLIGGAILRADDLVIDGSVTGRLKKLSETLTR